VRPRIDFRVDGRRVRQFEIYGMTAGEAAFDGQPGPPALARLEIAGPYNVTGPGQTPSRERIFLCRPAGAAEEAGCATRILTELARRAYRRAVTAKDIAPLLSAFASSRKNRDFDGAIAAGLRDILLAPDFLFRLEFNRPGAAPRTVQPVSSLELASRVSFFLWSSIPDDTLLAAAGGGDLQSDALLRAQVRRMLADPRANAFIDNFAAQWVGLRAAAGAQPDRQMFPEYDAALARAFQTETRLFLGNLIRENKPVMEVVLADHTYLNDRLAAHYNIAGVLGPGFRRVALPGNGQRGGLLAQGSMLTMTSHATRTSPVLRGKWILENLLNSPPPPPPANVPALDERAAAGRKLTAREQVERHRANPSCNSCHARIDPLGFALENYDAIGRWRTQDGDGPIDASAALPGRAPFQGPEGLKSLLAARSEEFVHATVERLLTYALGRELDARDQPAVRRAMRQTEAGGHRLQDLILAVIESAPFRMREQQEQ
jgi:hypothetical protein